MKIALLDSGIGGWSFLKKIESKFPQHTYLYFADQKKCPYGNKSLEELEKIAKNWIGLFKEKEIDVLVLACNTMTACFRQKFKSELNIPVIGTTDGLGKKSMKDEKVVLLATVKTVQSQWYQRLFPDAEMYPIGNTWLAKTIEERFLLSKREIEILKKEVEENAGKEWRKMILGCTHYPLIQDQLKQIWPEKTFIDPADTIAEELEKYLNIQKEIDGNIIMYTTGELELFEKQACSFFDEKKQNKISFVKI